MFGIALTLGPFILLDSQQHSLTCHSGLWMLSQFMCKILSLLYLTEGWLEPIMTGANHSIPTLEHMICFIPVFSSKIFQRGIINLLIDVSIDDLFFWPNTDGMEIGSSVIVFAMIHLDVSLNLFLIESRWLVSHDLIFCNFIRCEVVDIAVEMDRILRPGGYVLVQDSPEVINKLGPVLRSLHWSVTLHQEQFLVGKKGFWRPGDGSISTWACFPSVWIWFLVLWYDSFVIQAFEHKKQKIDSLSLQKKILSCRISVRVQQT